MGDFESLALIVVDARDEDRSRSVFEQFTHDAHALLGRFTRCVDGFGSTLAKVPMMIDEGVTHVGERKARKTAHRLVGRDDPTGDVVHELAQGVGVHETILARPTLRRSLEQVNAQSSSTTPPRVGFFGPFGTFTEQAVRSQPDLAVGELVAFRTVPDVLDAVADGSVDVGVVPIENSIEGTVNFTQDALSFDYTLLIQREIVLDIEHCLVALPGASLDAITTVLSIPVASAQCHRFIRENLHEVEVHAANSTADAAMTVADTGDVTIAAIAPRNAAALYGLEVLASNIEDHRGNQTRFVMVGRDTVPAPTGRDRTGIVVYQRADEPGSLISILQEFAARRINITNLLSRPTKNGGLGDYCFVMYMDGHVADELVADALRSLHSKQAAVKFLGSYPAAGEASPSAREHADSRWRQADDWVEELRSRIS